MEAIHPHLMIDLATLEHRTRIASATNEAQATSAAPHATPRSAVASALVALAARIAPRR